MSEGELPRFFAVPKGRHLRETLGLCAGFLVFFYAFYGAADALTHLHSRRIPLALPGELSIPFVPAAAIVYVSMNGFMLLSPFVYRTARELWPYVATLAAQTVLASIVFVILPVDLQFPQHEAPEGLVGAVFSYAEFANLRHNEFPSLHVTFALTTALVLGRRAASLWGRGLLLLWAAAIAASTVLIHTHYIADVVGGVALALAGAFGLYPRLAARADLGEGSAV